MSQNTFALTVFNTNVPKASVFKGIEHFCTQLVVAEEDCIYKYTNTGSKVHQIYMRTIVELFSDQIEQIIHTIYKEYSVGKQDLFGDVKEQEQRRKAQSRWHQPEDIVFFEHCDDKQEYIREITLYDLNSMRKNVKEDELSLGTQTYDWLMSTNKTLSLTDTFVQQHVQLRTYLTELHAHYWRKQHSSNMDNLQKLFFTCLNINN